MAMMTVAILQQDGGGSGAVLMFLAITVTVIAGIWKAFVKAGKPGWAILIPIYNAYVTLKIAGRPGWWLLLMLIPLVNLVVTWIVSVDIARSFGRGVGFGAGLFFLAPIFWMILGFGGAEYRGPAAAELTA